MKQKPHDCKRWSYWAGAATCAHGYELLPDGSTRKMALFRWRLHRKPIDGLHRPLPVKN